MTFQEARKAANLFVAGWCAAIVLATAFEADGRGTSVLVLLTIANLIFGFMPRENKP